MGDWMMTEQDVQAKRIAELETENKGLIDKNKRLRRALDNVKIRGYELGQKEIHDMALAALTTDTEAEEEKPDITKCPNCGGPADNGHDRELPPNPYWCTKCDPEKED